MDDTSLKIFSENMVNFVSSSEKLVSVAENPDSMPYVEKICEMLGIAKIEIIYKTPPRVNKLFLQDETLSVFSRDGYDETQPFPIVKRHKDGCTSTYMVYPCPKGAAWDKEAISRIDAFISAVFLINDRARIAAAAEKLSICDTEMDVYNARYIMKAMDTMFASGEIKDYCACRFNLANFSVVNAKLGREGGTEVMKRYIYRLRDFIGKDGFISKLGGGNFVALFKKEKMEPVKNYLSGIFLPIALRGLSEIWISAHAGYYEIDNDCQNPHEVMEALITAEAASRMNPKAPYAMYDEELKKRSRAKDQLEGIFFDAIDQEEFLVYYQPKVNLTDYTIIGAEALCRWQHEGELIPPMQFIPILEQSHNICVLDFYMLEHVCRDMRQWLDNGLPLVRVSVNLSRMHFGDERLAERITEIIDKYKIPREYIEIELTETTTDVDFKELKKVVSALRQFGISTSVDDFGVGYSSLNLICDLPWNVLKIDKSFLPDDCDENKEAKKVMLKYVISMAQDLDLECIVEGVESADQVTLLKGCSCFRAQGYLFDKPLPSADFHQKLSEGGRYYPEE